MECTFPDIDSWLDKPYWLVDVLPRRVPEDSNGQFFAVGQYFSNDETRKALLRKWAVILLKLNCYHSLTVGYVSSSSGLYNPSPASFNDMLLECQLSDEPTKARMLIMVDNDKALMTIDRDDSYITVYNPAPEVLDTLRALAAAEGLFVWRHP